jgi:predicted house-cleaning noncanonical NTP pyrophosphatase (MazG superfamily)
MIVVTTVGGDEYVHRLKEKLIEETREAIHAMPTAIVDELADVIEVVHALVLAHNASVEELLEAVRAKQHRLGGFNGGVVLVDNGLSWVHARRCGNRWPSPPTVHC